MNIRTSFLAATATLHLLSKKIPTAGRIIKKDTTAHKHASTHTKIEEHATNTHKYTYTHTYIYIRTDTHTPTHTHTRTHTHKNINTYIKHKQQSTQDASVLLLDDHLRERDVEWCR